MNSELLKALVSAIGGEAEELVKEFDKLTAEYPNITLLMTDVMRNGAILAQEVSDLRNNLEVLKNILVEAGVMTISTTPGDVGFSRAKEHVSAVVHQKEEIKINDIIWHQTVASDDDLPN